MVELTYFSLKKTTFLVRIFDISHCVFTQIPHPTSSPDRNLSKNTGRYVENTNTKSSFFLYGQFFNMSFENGCKLGFIRIIKP